VVAEEVSGKGRIKSLFSHPPLPWLLLLLPHLQSPYWERSDSAEEVDWMVVTAVVAPPVFSLVEDTCAVVVGLFPHATTCEEGEAAAAAAEAEAAEAVAALFAIIMRRFSSCCRSRASSASKKAASTWASVGWLKFTWRAKARGRKCAAD
jgi:hypothetical protein